MSVGGARVIRRQRRRYFPLKNGAYTRFMRVTHHVQYITAFYDDISTLLYGMMILYLSAILIGCFLIEKDVRICHNVSRNHNNVPQHDCEYFYQEWC